MSGGRVRRERYRLSVMVDPILGRRSWEDFGEFRSEESLAAAIREVAEKFRDRWKDLDKYVSVEGTPKAPSRILRKFFPDWSEHFEQGMRQCNNCMMFLETDGEGSDLCEVGRPWFGTVPCEWFVPIDADGEGNAAAAKELMLQSLGKEKAK